MQSIIIGFERDERTYVIAPEIIMKYPLSLIYGYWIENNKNVMEKIMLHTDYETFGKIYDVLTDKAKQYEVSENILNLLNHYGFINDTLYLYQLELEIKKRN